MGLLLAALVLAAGCTQQQPADACSSSTGGACPLTTAPAAATQVSTDTWTKVRLETSKGNITIALDPEMPVTAGNFLNLTTQGYYDGVIFHGVINGFMIQGGDPTGTGRGGPGYTIPDEFTSHNKNTRGAVAMANSGRANSGGSQFFINHVDNSPQLGYTFNSKYPVFGKVVEGMDVVDAIAMVETGAGDRPLQNVTIIRAVQI